MTYTIHRIPPSLNEFAGRRNDREYQEQKRFWKELVMWSCTPWPKKPIERAIVTITYYFPTRGRRDPDNYNGKMILDGLTAAKIIKDDSFQCIDLILKGDYDKKNPRTEICVEEQ